MDPHRKTYKQGSRNLLIILLVGTMVATEYMCFFRQETTEAEGIQDVAKTENEYIPLINVTAGISTMLSDIESVSKAAAAVKEAAEPLYKWSEEEAYLLAKIAMAEAEGEDLEGKALVILTVLNRVKSSDFPNTIKEVITAPGQFEPLINGRYDRVEPNEDCYHALALVERGWDESQGALYFEYTTTKSTWHSRDLQALFVHGCHTFYTEKEVEEE